MTAANLAPLEDFLRETIGLAVESVGHGLIERAAKREIARGERREFVLAQRSSRERRRAHAR